MCLEGAVPWPPEVSTRTCAPHEIGAERPHRAELHRAPPSTLAIFRLLRRPISALPLQRSALRPDVLPRGPQFVQIKNGDSPGLTGRPVLWRGRGAGRGGTWSGLWSGGGRRRGEAGVWKTLLHPSPQACDDGSLRGGRQGGGGSGKPQAGLTPPPGALPYLAFYGEEVRQSGSAPGAGWGPARPAGSSGQEWPVLDCAGDGQLVSLIGHVSWAWEHQIITVLPYPTPPHTERQGQRGTWTPRLSQPPALGSS